METCLHARLAASASLFFLACGAQAANIPEPGTTSVTIYSKLAPGAVDPDNYRPVPNHPTYNGDSVPGYAVIREVRMTDIPSRDAEIRYAGVAAFLDPTTVQFTSLSDPEGTKIAEQDYRFDLVDQEKLLQKYIGRPIAVTRRLDEKSETITGTLLSGNGGLTLRMEDGKVLALQHYEQVTFPDLPGGLMTSPSLLWRVLTDKPGPQKTETSYETRGITWWADYNLTFTPGKNANTGTIDVSSWVSIINQTGATFERAKLKLVAGDVAHTADRHPIMGMMKASFAPASPPMSAPVFNEKSFSEYHLYTLDQPVTLVNNATKQMELLPTARAVPARKELTYSPTDDENLIWNGQSPENYAADGSEGTIQNAKVHVSLIVKNTKDNGLGIPLPAGRMRVSEKDTDGAREFIGEDVIAHTPKDETILIQLGDAFDVTGARRSVKYTLDANRREADETVELTLANHKSDAVEVKVVENLYRGPRGEITSEDRPHNQENARQVSFTVALDPGQKEKFQYHVHYHW